MRKLICIAALCLAGTANAESLSAIAKADCKQPKQGILACDFGDPIPIAKIQTLAENAKVMHVAAGTKEKVALLLAAIPDSRHGQAAIKPVAKTYRVVAELTPAGVSSLAGTGIRGMFSNGVDKATGLMKSEPKPDLRDKLRAAIDSQCASMSSDQKRWGACKTAVQLRLCETEHAWGRDDYCPDRFETSKDPNVVAGRTCEGVPFSKGWMTCQARIKSGKAAAPESALVDDETVDQRIERRQAECNADGFFGVVGQGACRERVRIAECMGRSAENPAPGESRCQQAKLQTITP